MKIDNIDVAAPKSLTIDRNKLWSSNAGRLDSGYFVGDLIAVKTKLNIKWPPLSQAEASQLLTLLDRQFVSITYKSETGTDATKDFYFGDVSTGIYSWANGQQLVSGISCNAIER